MALTEIEKEDRVRFVMLLTILVLKSRDCFFLAFLFQLLETLVFGRRFCTFNLESVAS